MQATRTSLTPMFQGTLVGTTDTLSFVGYISVGLEPTAYALYVSIIIFENFSTSYYSMQCSPLCLDAVRVVFWAFYTID